MTQAVCTSALAYHIDRAHHFHMEGVYQAPAGEEGRRGEAGVRQAALACGLNGSEASAF